ncbi:cysteine-rich venom protein ophanin-like [Engystomops pustulosus]|uniref:cysteine-rich venom protein ophanin-like n=1 Tax=Engystomops pustulosus TaxID=76066 RepID=UPI003AFA504F
MWIIGWCVSALLMVHGVQTQPSNPLKGLATDDTNVQELIVNLTNKCRRTVQPPASNMVEAVWNKLAAEKAKEWASTCACKHSSDRFRELPDFSCWENVFRASHAAGWEEVINSFCNEKDNFSYGEGPRKQSDNDKGYTQVGSLAGSYPCLYHVLALLLKDSSCLRNGSGYQAEDDDDYDNEYFVDDGDKNVMLRVSMMTKPAWYSSSQVGCWVSYCPNAEHPYFYVCQYCPAGNVTSVKDPYESGPICADCPEDCRTGACAHSCPYLNALTNCEAMKKYCMWSSDVKMSCRATCQC